MNLSEPLPPVGPLSRSGSQTLQPGDLMEDFEVLQVLGLTGSGVLYLARQNQDGATVAVKEYMPAALAQRGAQGGVELIDPSHADAYQRGLQAFITEALTLSQFDHPNLLRVSSIWEANGTAYRTMPYLPGSSLLAWRSRTQQPASQAQLRQLLDGLSGALLTLYHNGLAHGQVEPLNVFLLEDGQPVLMDFDAVHHAVQSDPHQPYIDAYADPARIESLIRDDLHALARVLHFALSGDWPAGTPSAPPAHEALADVLLRFKERASALSYQPEFLSAIDAALALPLADRPVTVTELRAFFEPKPVTAPSASTAPEAPVAADEKPAKPPKRPAPAAPAAPAYPLNSSESVLALLANFDRGARSAEDVEPFQNPELPTLTEEAEPALPPLKPSLFDAMDAGESVPDDPVGYAPVGYRPMPRIPRNPWPRRFMAMGLAAFVVACVSALGWTLFG
jgi:serine/threonine protein kinase